MTPGLHNAPGPWRWEERGGKWWWYINDDLNIESGPHTREIALRHQETNELALNSRPLIHGPNIREIKEYRVEYDDDKDEFTKSEICIKDEHANLVYAVIAGGSSPYIDWRIIPFEWVIKIEDA